MTELMTNEWLDAQRVKPWAGREVLCLMSDGRKRVLTWNGAYWRDQDGRRYIETVADYVVLFYIFERWIEGEG